MTEPPDVPGHIRWLAHAKEDLEHAQSTLDGEDPIYRWVCVAAHQAAEKAFKAALIEAQIEFPRIHDLDRLQRLLPTESDLHDIDVDLASLTEWAIAGRYPADSRDADRDDAEQAVRDARTVVDAVASAFDEPKEEEGAGPLEVQEVRVPFEE